MIHIVAFLQCNPTLDRARFRQQWLNVHVPLIISRLPRLRAYRGYLPIDDAEADRLAADAIVTLGFDDLATLRAEMSSASFNAPDRVASSAALLDLSYDKSFLFEEVDFLKERSFAA